MKKGIIFLIILIFLPMIFAEINETNNTQTNSTINKIFNEDINLSKENNSLENLESFFEENKTEEFLGNGSSEINETQINQTTTFQIFDFMINILADGNTYFVNLFTFGSQGSKIVDPVYTGRFILTGFQAGTSNAQGQIYLANLGFLGNSTFKEISTPIIPVIPPSGRGIVIAPLECINDSGCNESSFCSENKCYIYECRNDEDCEDGKTCWINRCVKVFDMKIIEIQSPIYPGEFFDFTYFLKGVAEIHGDVIVRFWIEKNGEIVTEGFDTIYMGDFEEKTESTQLFLLRIVLPDIYNFYVEVNYDSYYARAGRVIEIQKIVEEKIIEEERRFFTGQTIAQIGEGIKTNFFLILIIIGIFLLFLIIYWERKKIKKLLVQEEKWIKRYRISVTTGFLLLILFWIFFYLVKLNVIGFFPLKFFRGTYILSQKIIGEFFFLFNNYLFYVIGIILLIIIIIFYGKIKKYLHLSKIFNQEQLIQEKFKKNTSNFFKIIKEKIKEKKQELKKQKEKRNRANLLMLKRKNLEKVQNSIIESKRKRLKLIRLKQIEEKNYEDKLIRIKKRKLFQEKFKNKLLNFFYLTKEKIKEKYKGVNLLMLKRKNLEKERKKLLQIKEMQKGKLNKISEIKMEKERNRLLQIKEMEEGKLREINKLTLKIEKKKLSELGKINEKIEKIERSKIFSIDFLRKIKPSKLSFFQKKFNDKNNEVIHKFFEKKKIISKLEKQKKSLFNFFKNIKNIMLKPFQKTFVEKDNFIPKVFLEKEVVEESFAKEKFIKNVLEKEIVVKSSKQKKHRFIPKIFLTKKSPIKPFAKEEFIPKKNFGKEK